MKVLLCLLSGQHVPNLLSVHHFRPDRLVLIESTGMKKKNAARDFLSALRFGELHYGERCEVLPLEQVNDLEATRECLRKAYAKYPDADWIANVTGGTKPMSIAAHEFFKERDARVIYIDADRPDEMLGLDGMDPEKCAHQLSIAEFLAGYGFESSKSDEKIAEAEARADQWWPCAQTVAQSSPGENLLTATPEGWDRAREKGLALEPGHLAALHPIVKDSIRGCFGLDLDGDSLAGSIDKYQGKFLTGEWLDVFFWGLLKRHQTALGLHHVHLGIEAKKAGTDARTDFDVAFMRNQALGAIECKSGTQEHRHDPTTPLDKLEARIQQFRALRVNPILATTSSKILDSTGELKPNIRDRAGIYQCRIVVRGEIEELAQSPDNLEAVRKLILDKESPQ